MTRLALFDFDGTITRKDSFLPFVLFSATRWQALLGAIILAPYIIGYKTRLVSSSTMRARLARFVFRGVSASRARELGRDFASQVLPDTVRSEASERLNWHKKNGDRIIVVSAALDLYLIPFCNKHGVELICTEMEVSDGRITGKYRDGDCTGSEKVARLLRFIDLSLFDEVFAYGDTVEDVELLRLASHRYFRWKEVDEKDLESIVADRVFEN